MAQSSERCTCVKSMPWPCEMQLSLLVFKGGNGTPDETLSDGPEVLH